MTRSGYVLLGCMVVAVAAGGYWLGRRHSGATPTAAPATQGRKILLYRSPMNPSVTSPVPAKDAMGMDYVPVYADAAGAAAVPGTVSIDPTMVQNIGVRTALVELRTLARMIRTVGRVDYDEQGLVRVHLRSDGWVEKLAVTETGQPVRRGQALLTLYSPQIVSSEQEYLLALHGVAALGQDAPDEIAEQTRALRDSSAERLRLLGVPESELTRLRDGGDVRREITLKAPASGIVQFIGVREGQFVSVQTEIYRIADLSTVWVLADLYEDEVPWVRPQDHAKVRLRGLPGQTLEARVDYIYPYLEGKTRTQKVRLRLANPGSKLKPDMYADVTFSADRRVDVAAVPESAVVRSGTRAQVFVARAPGRFEPREVRLGVAAEGYVQILDGVEAGDEVVVSGEFLIDSESKLREATAKLVPPEGAAPGKDHEATSNTSESSRPEAGQNTTPMDSGTEPAANAHQQ
jgi:membrane fusion protein, copper/silver efflux system